jgi:peroxiredoxin family protein
MIQSKPEQMSLILFSGDFDKAMAALTLANGAAGNGMKVNIFFTFWGISLLRRENQPSGLFLEKLFKSMMPLGADKIGLSKFNFCGVGPWLLKKLIRQKDGQTTQDLLKMAIERKVRFVACEASLKLLGINKEELINYEHLEVAGVDSFLNNALESKIAMFI